MTNSNTPLTSVFCADGTCRAFEREGGLRFRICGACRKTAYCSEECQRRDWKRHKSLCDVFSGRASPRSLSIDVTTTKKKKTPNRNETLNLIERRMTELQFDQLRHCTLLQKHLTSKVDAALEEAGLDEDDQDPFLCKCFGPIEACIAYAYVQRMCAAPYCNTIMPSFASAFQRKRHVQVCTLPSDRLYVHALPLLFCSAACMDRWNHMMTKSEEDYNSRK